MRELCPEVRGRGTALVLIPGGGGDAGMYEDAVPPLAEHHTVVTHDRRGNSRSPLPEPTDPVDVATLAAGKAPRSITGRKPGTMSRMLANADILITRELPAFCFDYAVDLDALRDTPVRCGLATGAESVGRPYHRPAHVLAELVGVERAEFPGGHTVYQDSPVAFAERLTELLKELEQCREQD